MLWHKNEKNQQYVWLSHINRATVNHDVRIITVVISLLYCNALFTDLQKKTPERLQLIQNSAARLLTRNNRREHTSPALAARHWLYVTFRIGFQVIFKGLNEQCPGLYRSFPDKVWYAVFPKIFQNVAHKPKTAPMIAVNFTRVTNSSDDNLKQDFVNWMSFGN